MPNEEVIKETTSIKDEWVGQEMGTAEACAYLGISRRTFMRMVSAQGIPKQERWKEFGKEYIYTKRDIEKLKLKLKRSYDITYL